MLVTLSVGLFALGVFLVVKTGLIKSWVILKTLPGLLSARMIYAALPLGIGFIALAIGPLLPSYDPKSLDITLVLFFLSPFVGFAFMIYPPNWVKPAWLRWLEREYGYCLGILIEEAQKMNRWEWEGRVRTRAGMQAWVDEVFAHRQPEIDRQWEEFREALLWEQARAEGRSWLGVNEKIKGYVPKHRRKEEEMRYRKTVGKGRPS